MKNCVSLGVSQNYTSSRAFLRFQQKPLSLEGLFPFKYDKSLIYAVSCSLRNSPILRTLQV